MAVLNRGKYEGGIQEIAKPDEVEEIRLLNQDDVRVYQLALDNFDNQENAQKTALATVDRYCGFLGGVRGERMFGWTVDRESEKPAELAVAVNGETRFCGVADVYREDIRRKGIHISGNCGFEIPLDKLGNLAAGDKISVHTADRAFELNNSPLTLQT